MKHLLFPSFLAFVALAVAFVPAAPPPRAPAPEPELKWGEAVIRADAVTVYWAYPRAMTVLVEKAGRGVQEEKILTDHTAFRLSDGSEWIARLPPREFQRLLDGAEVRLTLNASRR